jgi:hypothetical protein
MAWAGTRIVVALLTESLMLRELRFINPNGGGPIRVVGCAADLGNDGEDAAVTPQLVRGRVGVSLSKSLPARHAIIRGLVVDAPAGGIVHDQSGDIGGRGLLWAGP